MIHLGFFDFLDSSFVLKLIFVTSLNQLQLQSNHVTEVTHAVSLVFPRDVYWYSMMCLLE